MHMCYATVWYGTVRVYTQSHTQSHTGTCTTFKGIHSPCSSAPVTEEYYNEHYHESYPTLHAALPTQIFHYLAANY